MEKFTAKELEKYQCFVFLQRRVDFIANFLTPEGWGNIGPILLELSETIGENGTLRTHQAFTTKKNYYGNMMFNHANLDKWLIKHCHQENWTHFDTSIWCPSIAEVLDNNKTAKYLYSINGSNTIYNPNNENFPTCGFSMAIFLPLYEEKKAGIESTITKLKNNINAMFRYRFVRPWMIARQKFYDETGDIRSILVHSVIGDSRGGLYPYLCLDYENNFEWKNYYCTRSELEEIP